MSDEASVSRLEQGNQERQARDIGRHIRLRRTEVGANQADIGAVAGIHRATIRAVETGKSVEGRTLANVKRALGCSPALSDRPEVLRQVLSSRATAVLLGGILRSEEEEMKTKVSDYFDLVNALSNPHPELPPTFSRFMDGLETLIAPTDWKLVDREVRDTVGMARSARHHLPLNQAPPDVLRGDSQWNVSPSGEYPSVPQPTTWRALEPLPEDLLGAIERAGLPPSFQQGIVQLAVNRQAELRREAKDQLASEVGSMIEITARALRSTSEAMELSEDDAAVQEVVNGIIGSAVRGVFPARRQGRRS